jgi:hypothetical protein
METAERRDDRLTVIVDKAAGATTCRTSGSHS